MLLSNPLVAPKLPASHGTKPMGTGRMPELPYRGAMDKGGKAKKTGLYKLEQGEEVLTKEEAKDKDKESKDSKPKEKSKPKKSKPSHKKKHGGKAKGFHVKKAEGGYIATPEYEPDENGKLPPEEQHVHPDLDSVSEHMADHFEGDEPPAAAQQQAPPAQEEM